VIFQENGGGCFSLFSGTFVKNANAFVLFCVPLSFNIIDAFSLFIQGCPFCVLMGRQRSPEGVPGSTG